MIRLLNIIYLHHKIIKYNNCNLRQKLQLFGKLVIIKMIMKEKKSKIAYTVSYQTKVKVKNATIKYSVMFDARKNKKSPKF